MRPNVQRSLLAAVLFTTSHSQAATIVLDALKDNTLYSESDTLSNGAGEHFFAGSNALGNPRRAVIAFDIAGAIPAGSTIDSVALTLNMSMTSSTADQVVRLHYLIANWGEGASDAPFGEGAGTAAAPGDATWGFRFFATDPWTTAGGDFAGAASASRAVGAVGAYQWSSTAMRDDVQHWLHVPSNNLGWIMIGNEVDAASAKRFDSRQRAIVANRPQLTVHYTERTTGVGASPAAGVRLSPAVPNPFNPSTTIAYELDSAGPVRVSVFDVHGRVVRVLSDGPGTRGRHTVLWRGDTTRGDRAPSGVYWVRLETRGIARQQKIVLVR